MTAWTRNVSAVDGRCRPTASLPQRQIFSVDLLVHLFAEMFASHQCQVASKSKVGRLKMRYMKIRDGLKGRTWKCETWICGTSLHGWKLPDMKCRTNLQEWKMQDMKMRDQFAGVENAWKVSMESQSVKKCLKVVVFVRRVIPAV